MHVPNPKLTLATDRNQLEQVIINMIINAKDALQNTEEKEITLSAFQDDQNTFITIEDTGSGIPKEVQKRIFIPFFTTKPTGSGIGLSLSKQIVNLLGGSIKVTTQKQIGTKFYLVF